MRLTILSALTAIIAAIAVLCDTARAQPAENHWHDLPAQARQNAARQPWVQPPTQRAVGLNVHTLRAQLARAPLEGRTGSLTPPEILVLPTPDGGFERFRLVEAPVMAPELAAKFPEIKTYLGQGLDDRTATLRCDLTPAGFHAQVVTPRGWWYIDPRWRADDTEYAVYRKSEAARGDNFTCLTPSGSPAKTAARALTTDMLSVGGTLRTYRLAVAATVEYTSFHGGTVAAGLAAVVTAVNRVTGVYEVELSIRLVLVANNDLLIYTSSDPYTNNSPSSLLSQNQSNIDSVIGTANYDIGHVFSTAGGGLAGLGVVCISGQKARGETGTSSPIGDAFYIDYVAHEMGHQFGGDHTFNSTTSNCGSGNRNAATAWEVGSGTTIMAYAGICGADNVQLHSDPYFLFGSFEEIITYVTTDTGANCPVLTSTSNNPPVVSAGLNYTIPRSTPFTLTASGSDPDGDAVTFCWEERDLGAAQALTDPDNGFSPLFRSFNPTNSPARTFPRLSDILNNTNTLGEKLPTTSRLLQFRVTARDNHAGGGGVASADMQLTVDSSAGPFVVTTPNTATIWSGVQTVTWNVANTTNAAVNCSAVNILLSTNGGLTFPILLATNTPNDGAASVLLPNISNTTARIKIEAVDNVFFDISDTNFAIVPPPPIVLDSALLTDETCVTANGRIDPGETVMVSFALLNLGSTSTTNLIATLRATNGVTFPSGAQNYGAIPVGGVAAQSFAFTASGVCGGAVTCLIDVVDGTNNLGTVTNVFVMGTQPSFTKSSSATITIPDSGAASPYPSTIIVSNFPSTPTKVTVRLDGLTHTFPDDLDILLVGPGGQKVMLMSDAGGSGDISGVVLTFDSTAPSGLTSSGQIVSGTYLPSNFGTGDGLPAPAPAEPYSNNLAVFNGINPNGTWSLYVSDDSTGDPGTLTGWTLNLLSTNPICCTGLPLAALRLTGNAIPNPAVVGDNVTFNLAVTNAGPDAAASVVVSNPLPAGLVFVSVTNSQGTATHTNNLVTCSLGSLASGSNATITITALVTNSGLLTNPASATAPTVDPAPTNNSVAVVLTVPFDNDGDGLPDVWEIAHGLNPHDPTDAAKDNDGDGLTNLQEYLAGTDPNDSRNFLGIISVTIAAPDTLITFNSVAGKFYRVEGSDDLIAGNWNTIEDNVSGTGANVTVTDFNAADLPQRTYRVRLLP